MKFYTKGVTGYVDVKDVAKAMILLMDNSNFQSAKNQRYLLNAENLSYQNVFCKIADALEKPRPNIFASDFLLKLVWRAAIVAGWITRKSPVITRDIIASSNAVNNFNGNKIVKQFNFEYLPIEKSIQQTAMFLKQDMLNS
jgi:nucleoside-diphosphate-sugar epimerase